MHVKDYFSRSTFFCFSPLVMLVTFGLEFAMAAYAFVKFRTTAFGRLIIAILLALGAFQLAEYQICTTGIAIEHWTRFGLVAITLLPALGMHLVTHLTGKRTATYLADGVAALFVALFLLWPDVSQGGVCSGNYVILRTDPNIGMLYGIYYFLFLFVAIIQLAQALTQPKSPQLSRVQIGLIAGYLSFMLPMGVVYVASQEARDAVPSIMCGFALLLAFILTFYVAPRYQQLNQK